MSEDDRRPVPSVEHLGQPASSPGASTFTSPFGRRARKRLKRWLVFRLGAAVAALLGRLPLRWALALGAVIGRLGAWLRPIDLARAARQLEQALGRSPENARQLALSVFAHLGRVGAEIAVLPRIRPDLLGYVFLPDADRAVLAAAMAEGKGVLFVTGHLGNWELLAQRVVAEGYPAATLARGAPNPYLGAWLLARRQEGGVETINRGDPKAARQLLQILRKGGVLGVLIDQDTQVDSVHVPFFGRLAATPVAAAQLARSRKVPVVVGHIHREGAGHRVHLSRPELPPDDGSEAWLVDVTARLTARLEAAIREHPEEWPWLHDRWRTPPGPQGARAHDGD